MFGLRIGNIGAVMKKVQNYLISTFGLTDDTGVYKVYTDDSIHILIGE